MVKLRLHDEGEELDRRIDLVNVVFGAALGGYIGVVMTPARPRCLSGPRAVDPADHRRLHAGCDPQRYSHPARNPVGNAGKFPTVIFVLALIFFALIRGDTYLDISVLLPISIGWIFAFIVVVASHVMVCREVE